MRKLFWLFMMLLLAGCGGGGGTPAANTPPASGKGTLKLELVQSGTRVAKTVAGLPISQAGRYRIVLNEAALNFRKVVDVAFGEDPGTIELPVGSYTIEAILYEGGTPNVLTAYGKYGSTVVIHTGSNESVALAVTTINIALTPPAAVDSGATYAVSTIAAAALATNGLQEKWSLTSSISPFTDRSHLTQPAAATHTTEKAPAVGQGGILYFQGEFFMSPSLLNTGEVASNWAYFAEAQTTLNVPTIPVIINGPLPSDDQAPVVKSFSVPSAKQPTAAVAQIGIVGADNGGIKQYAITATATPVTGAALAAMAAPALDSTAWTSAPSFTFGDTVNSTDQTVYVYAWVKDFADNVSSQVEGVTNKKIVFNNSPVVSYFSVPVTATMNGSAIPVTVIGKGYVAGDLSYLITKTSAQPAAGAAGWAVLDPSATETGVASINTTFDATFTQAIGVRYDLPLYAWVKDSAGHVSPSAVRTAIVNDSPQITALTAAGAATGNTVSITRLEATAKTGRSIDGYCLTSTSAKPAVGSFTASVGVPSAPLPYTFTGITSTSPVTKAVYVWVKDDQGAISVTRGALVTLSAPTIVP